MRQSTHSGVCRCGHGLGLHDRHGCAAFLGAFAETAGKLAYCSCRRPSGKPLTLGGERRFGESHVVATVRVRERSGSAIAVCEQPPVLELGGSAQAVVERVKVRLRDAIAAVGEPQLVIVLREAGDACEVQVETLRVQA